jgi:hypothetical protein
MERCAGIAHMGVRRPAIQVMSENPYRLARDIRGIGFKTADAIAGVSVRATRNASGMPSGRATLAARTGSGSPRQVNPKLGPVD